MLFTAKDSLENVFQSIRHELHRGALDPKHPFRFVSFATCNNNGPDIRYVVLRSLEDQLHFYFFTDSRTKKVADIKKNSMVSLLFYHPSKRVQVKVIGEAILHLQNEKTEKYWSKIQGEGQKAYNPILPSGTPIKDPKAAYQWQEPMDDRYFCVIEIKPQLIEGLQLYGVSHIRMKSQLLDGKWSHSWLVP